MIDRAQHLLQVHVAQRDAGGADPVFCIHRAGALERVHHLVQLCGVGLASDEAESEFCGTPPEVDHRGAGFAHAALQPVAPLHPALIPRRIGKLLAATEQGQAADRPGGLGLGGARCAAVSSLRCTGPCGFGDGFTSWVFGSDRLAQSCQPGTELLPVCVRLCVCWRDPTQHDSSPVEIPGADDRIIAVRALTKFASL
ncbi:hypothetical protein IP84_13735 [beta proteobacterium AAP99]|nr:hypothetical protein IP84_13735 [beta proteobacterium AAP99]